jgi:hypothetical protein
VPAKTRPEHLLQLRELGDDPDQQPDLGAGDGDVGRLQRGRLAQRRGAQHRLDLLGPSLDVTTSSPFQDPGDLRP